MDLKKLNLKVKEQFMGQKFLSWKSKAQKYIDDKDKAEDLLNKARKKAEVKKKGSFEEIWNNIKLLFSLFGDWINGSYRDVPLGSIVVIIIGLIYFLTPMDIIPDFIIAGGYVDDAAVLGFIIKQIGSDLNKYNEWKLGQV